MQKFYQRSYTVILTDLSNAIRKLLEKISFHKHFSQPLLQGTFPYDWKISKVTPIYKKGPKHDMNNYRPISVISTIAKVMEKIAHNQLYLYLRNENILSPSQHGFRQEHSTVTALLEITDRLYHNIDIGELN